MFDNFISYHMPEVVKQMGAAKSFVSLIPTGDASIISPCGVNLNEPLAATDAIRLRASTFSVRTAMVPWVARRNYGPCTTHTTVRVYIIFQKL